MKLVMSFREFAQYAINAMGRDGILSAKEHAVVWMIVNDELEIHISEHKPTDDGDKHR